MMEAPYQSIYYEITPYYERFGNYKTQLGAEIFIYISDHIVHGIDHLRYSISNKMRIYDYKKQEFVHISYNTLYPTVNLYNVEKGGMVTLLLHRLYMLVFCYFPGCEKYEVNHIDGNKQNCSPSNLEWMTHKENMNHAFKYIKTDNLKLSDQDIIEIIEMYNNDSKIKEIADMFSISAGYVMDIVRRTGKCSERLECIRHEHPITREKNEPKLSDTVIKEAAERYNNGSEYFELANYYGVDRSYLTKAIKEYAKQNPGTIVLRPLKKFDPETVDAICQFFQANKHLSRSLLYKSCLDEFNIEDNSSNKKAIKNIFNGVTHRNISSKYNFQ